MQEKSGEKSVPVPNFSDRIGRKFIEYGILALIIFSPLPAASVYEWSILVIQLTVLAMMSAYLMLEKRQEINPNLESLMKWPKIIFSSLFVLILLQTIPLPRFLVRLLNPRIYSFQESFSFDFAGIKFMSLSLVPSETLREGLELLTYFLLAYLILKTVTRRHQIQRILYLLVGIGSFEALYGLFELYRKEPRILFYKKVVNLDSATGTFVNRTNFSGYLEMILPLAIGLIIARIDLISLYGKRGRDKILHLARKGAAINLVLTATVVLIAVAILKSKSRSGAFILVLTFILFAEFVILYFRRYRRQQSQIKNYLKVTFLLMTFVAFYIGIGATLERFTLDNMTKEGRLVYWSNVTPIISDFPLFGTGLGTFVSVYPAYEKTETWGHFIHAHNDYLEFFSELGLIGALLLFGGIFYAAVRTFFIWIRRRNPELKGIALGGFVAMINVAIHTVTDFSLHIPANMLLLTVIISLTIVTATHRKKGIIKRSKQYEIATLRPQ